MAALSIAIIGKNNEPLYMKQFEDASSSAPGTRLAQEDLFLPATASDDSREPVGGIECLTRYQFILHAALDRFEQLAGPIPGLGWRKPGASGADGMFVGLLMPYEEMRVYGYYTTTKIMFMLIVEDDAVAELQQTVDSEIKILLLYIEDLLNPFKEIGSVISSRRFDESVDRHVAAFNQSEGII